MTLQEIFIGKKRVFLAEPPIGEGGEGKVHAIMERSRQVVKIYNANLRSEREDKVRAMVNAGLAAKNDMIAFPGEIATDCKGNFLGFVMRRMSGKTLHELYSPKSRKRHFPGDDYRFLVHTALNISRAVGNVHQTGCCVIGDLNHSSILVAPDAKVALIDADSFQFRLNGMSYPCAVGVPEFTPPELQGKDLSTVERTEAHDHFGLAVAIFLLLFMGRYPYAGIREGPETSIGEDIAQNRFAYSEVRRAQTQTRPPDGALTLDLFPDTVSMAFEEAFGLTPGARPNVRGWIDALLKLKGSLIRCGRVKTHYYPSASKGCVWCKLSAKYGLDMFPDLSMVIPNMPNDARGTEQAIHEILAFRLPTVADLLSKVTVPGSSPALQEAKRRKRVRSLMGLTMMGGALAGFISAVEVWFIWIGLAIWGASFLRDREVSSSPFEKAFRNADKRVQHELDAFVRSNGFFEVLRVRGDMDAAIAAYRSHDDALASELKILRSNRESRQRLAYLNRFPIRRASISGIGAAKKAMLISFGIETAADVISSKVLGVPGFGHVMTGKLVAWRRSHESRFIYDRTPNAQDVADETALRRRFADHKVKLESAIRNGLGTLRNMRASLNTLTGRAKRDKALSEALAARAQAERDLKELGASVPASSVVLSVPSPVPPSKAPRVATLPPQQTTVPSVTPNCPRCGSTMRQRSGLYGKFWGCSQYPRCRATRNI